MVNSTNLMSLDTRIESEGFYGTIKYCGEVDGTKGVWLGVEWDDPSRGKHNGSHNGKLYFTTNHPTGGSFIRHQKANFGITFSQAVNERYGLIEDENAGIDTDELYLHEAKRQVEMVGAKQVNLYQSQLENLVEISMNSMNINGEDRESSVCSRLIHVKTLDLSLNLLPSWEAVASITKLLKKLTLLNIGSNPLTLPENKESVQGCFQHVRCLYMSRTGYNWDQVLSCLTMFPALTELHVCYNNIAHIESVSEHVMNNITVLNLEGNIVGSWQYILNLGQLQHLETLILSSMDISTIYFDDSSAQEKTKYFVSLKNLYLLKNKIAEWNSIDQLNKLQRLEELYMLNNPITQCSATTSSDTIRCFIIARIANLKVLNRTKVTAQERWGSEIDYLKMYGREWRASGGHQDPAKNSPSAEFIETHPRYQEIVDKYGPVDDLELKEMSSALTNTLIAVTIISPQLPEVKAISKKLPVTMSVPKLKALVKKLLRIKEENIKLSYRTCQGQLIAMDSDTKEIGFFAIDHGDTIIVDW